MYYDGSVHIEADDQCATCEYYLKGVACPLLEALGMGVVELRMEVQVQNCGFYREFKRRLKLIDVLRPDSASSAEVSTPGKDSKERQGNR
jgi:hypothetical protein